MLCFFCFSCSNLATLKQYYANEEISLTNGQKHRLSNYLSGEYYSFELKRNVIGYPIAFAISENGENSIIIACASYIDECNHSIQLYQQMEKYKKKTNLNYKILALKKKIVINNQSLKILSTTKKFKPLPNLDDSKYFDYLIIPSDSCGGDDC